MKNEKDWIDGVFESMEGSQKVGPSPEVFERLEKELYPEVSISRNAKPWLSYAAAVAVLVLNLTIVTQYMSSNQESESYLANSGESSELLTTYNIY